MTRDPLTLRVARWSARHPWRAVGLWALFVAASMAVGNAAGLNQMSAEDGDVGETARARDLVNSAGFDRHVTENVLITAWSGALDRAAAEAAADDAVHRMRARAGVREVAPPVPAPDGSALLVAVTVDGDPATAAKRVAPLLATTAAVQRDHPEVRVEQVGPASIQKGLDDSVGRDFKKAELISVPVTVVVLLVAFGALLAAGVPVLLALSAVGSAIGLSALASQLVPAYSGVNSVILLVGMAVGVDYSLFYLRREREARAGGAAQPRSVEIAAETSGRAIVVSAVAVMVSMAGLYIADDLVFASLGTGSILVVAASMIGSLTVLPALLAKLGRWVDRPRVPLLWRLTNRSRTPRFWPAVLRPALRRPWLTLTVSVAALVLLAAPALDMRLRFPATEDFPHTIPVMHGYDRLTAAFPASGTAHEIVVRAPAERAAEVTEALATLYGRAKDDRRFAADGPEPRPRTSPDGRTTVVEIASPFPARSAEARDAVLVLRGDLLPATVGRVPGAEYAVRGPAAADMDYGQHIRRKLPLVIGFVLLLTFLVMVVTFRSLAIALTAIALNLLSVGAAYGLVTLVFQDTARFEDGLGFTSIDAVVPWVPLFLFVILFGLSMDYHVFVVSRIREAARAGMETRQAVAYGVTTSAGVVTSAAVVMVAVFAVFATLSTIDMKQAGVGLAVAILVDATVIRAVVLPAAMSALGQANWWAPRFLRDRTTGWGRTRPRHAAEPPEADRRDPLDAAAVRYDGIALSARESTGRHALVPPGRHTPDDA